MSICSEDVALFHAASHDLNPLVLDPERARRTPFGEPLVYGVLGGLAALGRLADRPGFVVRDLTMEFRSPLFVGGRYTAVGRWDERRQRAVVELFDGRRPITRVTVTYAPGAAASAPTDGGERPPRESAAEVEPTVGTRIDCGYEPGWAAVRQLCERYGLTGSSVGATHVAAACFASWLVGSELPGASALFTRLSMSVAEVPIPAGPLSAQARVVSFDPRFELASVQATYGDVSALSLQAVVVRAPSPAPLPVRIDQSLAGRSAVVVGASRGLGAAIARVLALQGARVVGLYRRSHREAEALAIRVTSEVGSGPGSLELMAGDASDPEACAAAIARAAPHGRLDVLVCCASPLGRPLALAPTAVDRMTDHLSSAFRMAASPLAAGLDALGAVGGCVVGISGTEPHTSSDQAQRLAAEQARESLFRWCVARHPIGCVMIRSPRLQTDSTLNPHLEGALDPEIVAQALADLLVTRPAELVTLEIPPGNRPRSAARPAFEVGQALFEEVPGWIS